MSTPTTPKIITEEMKQALPREVYEIAFEQGTETPFSSPLNHNHETGIYSCQVCGNPLFKSDDKYDSGSGWPSFTQPISENSIETSVDYKIGYPRTEVHCKNCGAHLGHVFDDGPTETGNRFCMNGTVLQFDAEKQEL